MKLNVAFIYRDMFNGRSKIFAPSFIATYIFYAGLINSCMATDYFSPGSDSFLLGLGSPGTPGARLIGLLLSSSAT